jgi:hypothetical protein
MFSVPCRGAQACGLNAAGGWLVPQAHCLQTGALWPLGLRAVRSLVGGLLQAFASDSAGSVIPRMPLMVQVSYRFGREAARVLCLTHCQGSSV